ncbi:MAG TPA: DUF998 domain-containing protein [Anaerolineales bacterium]|nr:DUF998 domain-containing protein [Anaerolineales bacterium]
MKTHTAGSDEGRAPNNAMIRKALLACGMAAALTWMGTDIFAALSYDGYNFPLDPISGLSAVDAPTRAFVVPLDCLYALLKIAFALGIWISSGHHRAMRITAGLMFAFGLTDLAANFFPWNPDEPPLGTFINLMHSVLAGGLPVVLFFLTIGFGAAANGKWFRIYSYGTLLVLAVLGALPLLGGFQISADQPPEWFGASERINAYGFMLWMTLLALVLLRSQRGRTEQQPQTGGRS